MKPALIITVSALLAFGTAFATNWLALRPWRRSREQHWTEQARLLFPARRAAASNLLVIPGILMLATVLIWPDSGQLWIFVGMAGLLTATVGTMPLEHEIVPRVSKRDRWRQAAFGTLQRFFPMLFFLGGASLMPDEFGSATWIIAGLVVAIGVLWSRALWLWVAPGLGLLISAPERLQRIAFEVSAQMKIPYRAVRLFHLSQAQAFALPRLRSLVFTERLLEILSDDELAGVCAHELAHLTESKAAQLSRKVVMLMVLPWLFFHPVIHHWKTIGLFALSGCSMAAPFLYRVASRRLEKRADHMAKATETGGKIYARALTKLYEDNLVPAVIAGRTTHPDLFDRIVAAGVTPDFPKPIRAKEMAWNGTIFAMLFGVLIAMLAIKTVEAAKGTL